MCITFPVISLDDSEGDTDLKTFSSHFFPIFSSFSSSFLSLRGIDTLEVSSTWLAGHSSSGSVSFCVVWHHEIDSVKSERKKARPFLLSFSRFIFYLFIYLGLYLITLVHFFLFRLFFSLFVRLFYQRKEYFSYTSFFSTSLFLSTFSFLLFSLSFLFHFSATPVKERMRLAIFPFLDSSQRQFLVSSYLIKTFTRRFRRKVYFSISILDFYLSIVLFLHSLHPLVFNILLC